MVQYARHMARHARYTGRRTATRLGIWAKEASRLVDDFQQALEYSAREAQFLCRLDRCVTEHGTSFGADGWKSFLATAGEIITDPAMDYVGSTTSSTSMRAGGRSGTFRDDRKGNGKRWTRGVRRHLKPFRPAQLRRLEPATPRSPRLCAVADATSLSAKGWPPRDGTGSGDRLLEVPWCDRYLILKIESIYAVACPPRNNSSTYAFRVWRRQ